jgi:hypothetical protein
MNPGRPNARIVSPRVGKHEKDYAKGQDDHADAGGLAAHTLVPIVVSLSRTGTDNVNYTTCRANFELAPA